MDSIAQREKWAAVSGWRGDGSTNELAMQTDQSIDDVLNPRQQFVVFQVAHEQTQIRSHDANPWIRVVGFLRTLDEARALAKRTFDDGDKAETRIMPCGRNFLIGKKKYDGMDLGRREEEQLKSNKMIDMWIEKRLQTIRDTELRAKTLSKTIQTAPASEQAQTPTPTDIIWPADAESDAKPEPEPEPVSVPVPVPVPESSLTPIKDQVPVPYLQRYFAMAVIPDFEAENEPSVIALWVTETEEEQKIKLSTASKSKDLIHFDIVVGSTGVWLPLSQTQSGKVIHHNPLRQSLEENIKWSLKQ